MKIMPILMKLVGKDIEARASLKNGETYSGAVTAVDKNGVVLLRGRAGYNCMHCGEIASVTFEASVSVTSDT